MTSPEVARVVSAYRRTGKIDLCARKCGISWSKARKILVLSGEYTTAAFQAIQALCDAGLSPSEIAASLGMTERRVRNYLPYTKGLYKQDSPSYNAIALRKSRAKRKEKKESAD